MASKTVKVMWAGCLNYQTAYRLQQLLAKHHQDTTLPIDYPCNSLILLEHKPVYTVGIRKHNDYNEKKIKQLTDLGAEFYKTNRGGLITFHGPGQLVAYPIINLRQFQTNIKCYVSKIEQMIIKLCDEFGIKAKTSPDTGVWVGDEKICAIGIHGSRYITTHGLALNCNTDLKWFDHIVPCGIEGKGVTSISKQLDKQITVEDICPLFKKAFRNEFQCSTIDLTTAEVSQFLHSSSSDNK